MDIEQEIAKTSILILDDDVLQARALSKKLKKIGYTPAAVTHTGIQAIQAAQQHAPDIALLDIRLSGQAIDGIEVGKKLLQIDENIIIIYITAYGNDDNFKKALASNPHAFIEKPYQMKRLNWEIEMAIRRVILSKETPEIETKPAPTPPQNKRMAILCFSNFLLIKNGTASHELVNIEDLIYLKANGVYTDIHTKQGKRYCISMVLRKFEERFLEQAKTDEAYKKLARIHNSYIVNVPHIQQVDVKKNGGKLVLSNEEVIAVSRSYVDDFWAVMAT